MVAGLIEKNPDKTYELTVAGRELGSALEAVWGWSQRWASRSGGLGTDQD
ncbi:hypothetical protein [Nocardia sp. NPDC050435]